MRLPAHGWIVARLLTLRPALATLRPALQAPKDEAGRSQYRDAAAPYRRWYRTKRWLDLRHVILLRDSYACQMSGVLLRGGRSDRRATSLRPAVIDHLIPHEGDPALFWDPDNLWAVSADMHDTVCQSLEARLAGEAVRDAKLAHRVASTDGRSTTPVVRWVDRRWG